jgi:hypothetical protein
VTPPTAARTCTEHIPVPSTRHTARSNRPRATHGAHHPNGSPGTGSDTPHTPPPRDHHRMPWNNARPRAKRYGAAHQTERDRHMAILRATGAGLCAETVCIKRTRVITPDDDLHLAHDPTGTVVLGLAHAACNRHEAAVRARKMQGRNSGRTLTATRQQTTRRSQLRW